MAEREELTEREKAERAAIAIRWRESLRQDEITEYRRAELLRNRKNNKLKK